MAGRRNKPLEVDLLEADEAVERSRVWADPEFAAAITDRSLLRHTCYIELCPDHLRKRACWNEGALFYTQTTFELLAPTLRRLADYDPYGFHSYGPGVFAAFTSSIRSLADNLASAERDVDVDSYWFSEAVYSAGDLFAGEFEAARLRLLRFTSVTADTLENWIARSDTLHVFGL